ncbi:hypothetical protein AGMMS50267_03020 [Spirochaetia bacterium]|nr:hypothetical protein AGMMS50267_03020 [Spirochaetia bacterium]
MKPITETMMLLLLSAVLTGVLSGCPTGTTPEGSGVEPDFSGTPLIINLSPDDPRYDPDTFNPVFTVRVGDTLYVDTADLADSNPLIENGEYFYFWFRAGNDGEGIPIPGAYQASYTTVSADIGCTIWVVVHGSGYQGGVESDPVGSVQRAL